MSDKYIIRNCNVLYFNPDKTAICNDLNLECPCECKERADCVMKQIVELCKNKDYFVKRFPDAQFSSAVQNSELAFDILQLLDIQECE